MVHVHNGIRAVAEVAVDSSAWNVSVGNYAPMVQLTFKHTNGIHCTFPYFQAIGDIFFFILFLFDF